jgi:hypothetical protein
MCGLASACGSSLLGSTDGQEETDGASPVVSSTPANDAGGTAASADAALATNGGGDARAAEVGSDSGPDEGDGSPSDRAAQAMIHGDPPDAFPASCGDYAFTLVADAAANTCAVSPADVACTTDGDCVPFPIYSCGGGCFQPIFAVNKSSTSRCDPPPCLPPTGGCPGDASGFYLTQDCRYGDNSPYLQVPVDSGTLVEVACVNHRCQSYAAPAP